MLMLGGGGGVSLLLFCLVSQSNFSSEKREHMFQNLIEIACLFHSLLHILSCCVSFGGWQGACDAYIIRNLGK